MDERLKGFLMLAPILFMLWGLAKCSSREPSKENPPPPARNNIDKKIDNVNAYAATHNGTFFLFMVGCALVSLLIAKAFALSEGIPLQEFLGPRWTNFPG